MIPNKRANLELEKRMSSWVRFKITGEEVFQIWNSSFGITPSSSGYTLKWGFDKNNLASWPDATPADEPLAVLNIPAGAYIKLSGNTDTVNVSYTID